MGARPSLDDYVDVAERIVTFIEKHPEGSLQTIGWEVRTVAGKEFVVYQAAAYRDPTDIRPGHGTAWEPFPGTTPYTKNSELMNAETAAWGRAILAVGLAANKHLASRQEVKARQAESEAEQPEDGAEPTITLPTLEAIRDAWKTLNPAEKDLRLALAATGAEDVETGALGDIIPRLTEEQGQALVDILAGVPQ